MGQKPEVFVRQATGLVREVSPISSLLMNMTGMNIALGALTYTSAPYVLPGSDPVVATLIATGLSMFVSLMYTLFVWAMPRSGGDYIFVSRIMNPSVGFIINFNITFWYIIFIGIAANWVSTFALSPALLIVGSVTKNSALIDLANRFTQPAYIVVIGIVFILIITALTLRGVKALFGANNVLFIVSIVGVAIMIALLASSSHAGFVSSFNNFASYDGVVSAAHGAGYSPRAPVGQSTFISTLGVTPYIFASTGYGILTAYWAGEAKQIKKNAFLSQVGATAIVGLALALIGALAIRVFGYDFLGSITQLGTTGSSAYPFSAPPYLNLFVSMLTSNPIVLWVLAVAYVAAVLSILPATYMVGTRNIFAWSFDRLVPTKLSDVNERTHTPIYAIALVAAINVAGLLFYTFGPPSILSLVSGAGLAEILSLIAVAITAIIFPYVKKDFFEKSPANIRVGRIPLITIAGFVSLAFYLLIEYYYFTNSLYGANIPIVYATTAFSLLTPLVIYVVAYYYRRSKGVNLSLAFKELPPE